MDDGTKRRRDPEDEDDDVGSFEDIPDVSPPWFPKNLWGEFLQQCSITTDWDDRAWYASILQCRCLCPGCEGLGNDQAEVEEVQREELVLPRPFDQDL